MKRTLLLLAVLTTTAASAGPLNQSILPAETRWVVHIDLDALRASQFGMRIEEEVLAKHAENVKRAAKLDLPAILQATHSITAYGSNYDPGDEGKGILLWSGEPEIEQIAAAFLIQQTEATKAGEGSVKKLQSEPFAIYQMDDKVCAAVMPGHGIMMGRSTAHILEAANILNGTTEKPATNLTYADYPAPPRGAFLTGYIDSLGQNAKIPPQAEVLKMTDGGRIAIGERNENIELNITLRARSTEVTQQIQQVIQGMVALASLSLGDQPELQSVARSTQVEARDQMVTVQLAVPLSVAMERMDQHHHPTE